MSKAFQPWEFLIVAIAGRINRDQQKVIDYLMEENRVLRGQLRSKRLRLTDEERRRLAVKAKALGRKLLREVAKIGTPDRLLAWHRKLIAKKWDYSSRRKRPGVLPQALGCGSCPRRVSESFLGLRWLAVPVFGQDGLAC